MSGLTLTAFRQLTLFRTNLLRSNALSSSLVPVQSCQATSNTSKLCHVFVVISAISLFFKCICNFSNFIIFIIVKHLVAVVVEHLEAEEHVADCRDVGLDARGASHRVEEVRHWVAVVLQISFYLA